MAMVDHVYREMQSGKAFVSMVTPGGYYFGAKLEGARSGTTNMHTLRELFARKAITYGLRFHLTHGYSYVHYRLCREGEMYKAPPIVRQTVEDKAQYSYGYQIILKKLLAANIYTLPGDNDPCPVTFTELASASGITNEDVERMVEHHIITQEYLLKREEQIFYPNHLRRLLHLRAPIRAVRTRRRWIGSWRFVFAVY
jgi:hypothetical protein